jgi:prepilin-type N-terminal cleavage/methylation domain-containing protein
MVTGERIRRRSHAQESGLTLIEIIVSLVILAIVTGAVAATFFVAFKAVAPNGPQARLLGAHDLTILEEALGRDGARAACIEVPPGGASNTFGSCANGFASVETWAAAQGKPNCTANPNPNLCIGWVQVSDLSCHVAVYPGGSSNGTRTEYARVGSGTPSLVGSVPLAREQQVNLQVGTPPPTPYFATPPGETYNWIRSLPVTITALGVTNGPSQVLALQPVATDPNGALALVGPPPGAKPC